MKRNFKYIIAAVLAVTLLACRNNTKDMNNENQTSWQERLEAAMPLLGHRNWIVITDMAYPLQSSPGIETIVADEDFGTVLTKVKAEIDSSAHVFAHVYHDRELDYLTDSIAPGVSKVKAAVNETFGTEAKSMEHEDIIKKLDNASKLYKILIIKTPLTVPYTSIFLELDCKYWSAEGQKKLDELMKK